MLTWNSLAKAYGRRRLFADLNGHIAAGCGLMVVGRNGSGKSTFLKVLVGLVRPDDGQIVRPADRDAIGYAAPHMAAYAELTGLENLTFFAGLHGVSAHDATVRGRELLERLGLQRAAEKPVATYSTGMAQRLRLACAVIHRPQLLALDEPTIGLDQEGVRLVEQVVAEHIGNRGAALIATNDIEHFAGIANGEEWSRVAMGS